MCEVLFLSFVPFSSVLRPPSHSHAHKSAHSLLTLLQQELLLSVRVSLCLGLLLSGFSYSFYKKKEKSVFVQILVAQAK